MMKIEKAQYYQTGGAYDVKMINATIDGEQIYIPLDPDNRHYAEILKQVKEGTLTIKDAD